MLNLHNNDEFDEKNEEDDAEDTEIRWSNLLFLPFHPIFRGIVIFVVVIKTILVSFFSI